ncbi:MAG: efflux transporter outer membrane subunit [Candidatus Krumholzibacteria bacterium]|nr:efflux transporter outer membrane subunit [Candidatus Krumholzibacteria bacterium]
MKRASPGVAVLALALACASAPERKPPEFTVEAPPAWTAAPGAEPDTTGPPPVTDWWRGFADARLDSLVEEALAQNLDILAAAARVEAAAATARAAGADLWPQLSAAARGSRTQSNIIGIPIPGAPEVIQSRSSSFGASLDLSWEIDLWGRVRKAKSAALADAQASAADLASARLSIAGQTAKAYFAVVEARAQLRLAEATVESFERSAEFVRRRYEEGVRPALDLRIALTTLAQSRALLELRRQQMDAATRGLEILLARYPAAAFSAGAELPPVVGDVPAGLPADLLIRRPDLFAAERRYAASESRVGEARRAFFPRITLTGSAGTLSNDIEDLVDLDFGVWSIAAGLVQPIFQGGRLRANLARSHAAADQALVAYVQALLRAFGEVETAIVAEGALAERARHLEEAALQSEAAQGMAERQYVAGLVDYITVLETQRQALSSQIELITVRRQRLDARINLHLALGGGFDLTQDWRDFLDRTTNISQNSSPGGSR